MPTNLSEKSLVEILIERRDTGFKGCAIEESTAKRYMENNVDSVYQDEFGQYFTHSHDYVATKEEDGEPVGILVGDRDGRNCMDHPYSHLPHPIGLYVREAYRSQGIASKLIHDYMDWVGSGACVIDCATRLVPFYEQFDYEMIYLQSYKRRMEPTKVPLPPGADQLDIDISNSPIYDVPFVEADAGGGHSQGRLDGGSPSIIIRQNSHVGQQCDIEIQMPYSKDEDGQSGYYQLTESAISEVNTVLENHSKEANVREQSVGTGDFHRITQLDPDTARTLADELCPIVVDAENAEFSG